MPGKTPKKNTFYIFIRILTTQCFLCHQI